MRRRALLAGVTLGAPSAFAQSASVSPNPQAPTLNDAPGPGFSRLPVARWGDGILPGAPPFSPFPLTGDQAGTQFAYDGVIAGLIAPPAGQDGIARQLLILANPDAPARLVFPGGVDDPNVAGKLQGATVMNLQFQNGRWVMVEGGYQSRRLTDGTLCRISGPVAGAIGGTVQGLLAPKAACVTPWSTALFAEGDAAPWLTRLQGTDYGYGDPATAPRFGWVVELNPLDPGSFPIKRTALGRFPRAGIAATLTPDGRPVVFMAQEDPAGLLFRFTGLTSATDGTALDAGTLAVAQIQDTQIVWIDLDRDIPALVGAISAGQAAGGSPFDAPAGIAVAPDGTLYMACAGNPARQPEDTNPLNPRAGDDNGHIIVLHPTGGDLTAKIFDSEIAIAAGNPATTAFTQYTAGSASWFRRPRTLNLNAAGELWIGTDQNGATTAAADGLFVMQTGGPSKFLVTTAYLAPVGAAIGGVAFDAGSGTSFGMVRHPGATPNATFDTPATRWPNFAPPLPPRGTVISLTRA